MRTKERPARSLTISQGYRMRILDNVRWAGETTTRQGERDTKSKHPPPQRLSRTRLLEPKGTLCVRGDSPEVMQNRLSNAGKETHSRQEKLFVCDAWNRSGQESKGGEGSRVLQN